MLYFILNSVSELWSPLWIVDCGLWVRGRWVGRVQNIEQTTSDHQNLGWMLQLPQCYEWDGVGWESHNLWVGWWGTEHRSVRGRWVCAKHGSRLNKQHHLTTTRIFASLIRAERIVFWRPNTNRKIDEYVYKYDLLATIAYAINYPCQWAGQWVSDW